MHTAIFNTKQTRIKPVSSINKGYNRIFINTHSKALSVIDKKKRIYIEISIAHALNKKSPTLLGRLIK